MTEKTVEKKENEIFEWVKAILIAIVIAAIVRTFLFETIEVRQYSMYDTFDERDRVIIGKMHYRFEEPQYGQIIVFQTDEMAFPYIKRVIGVEGDTIAITNGQLLLNGEVTEESYIYEPMLYDYPETEVPDEMMFVMGDNRNSSKDSRSGEVGFVPVDSIRGIVRLKIWPINEMKWFQADRIN